MKKFLAIVFISLLCKHFAPAFSNFFQHAVICTGLEDERITAEDKEPLKENIEKKDFEFYRHSHFTVTTQQVLHCSAFKFHLQNPPADIPTPPPNQS